MKTEALDEPVFRPDSLEELRWNWGDAYRLFGAIGRWYAERRDGRRTLVAENIPALRDRMIADYGREPVPRTLAASCPACGWPPECHDEYSRCPVTQKRSAGPVARLRARIHPRRGN